MMGEIRAGWEIREYLNMGWKSVTEKSAEEEKKGEPKEAQRFRKFNHSRGPQKGGVWQREIGELILSTKTGKN